MLPFLLVAAGGFLIGQANSKKFADGGTLPKLLAPNGKPSNLTPEQYKLVRTPEFKAWFGDWENDPENASKVVDENGEPKIMWHYARRLQYWLDKFYVFKTTKQLGAHFGTLNQIKNLSSKAKHSIENNEIDFRLYQVFLNVKNPIRMVDRHYWENEDLIEELIDEDDEFINGERNAKYFAKKYKIDGILYLNKFEIDKRDEADYEEMSDEEFKMIIPEAEDSLIVFEPTQIKLANGTNTTFDANNPDIRYAKGGKVRKVMHEFKIGKLKTSAGKKVTDRKQAIAIALNQ